jgi:hypothetical protein
MDDYRIANYEIIDHLAVVRRQDVRASTTIRTETGRLVQVDAIRDTYIQHSSARARLLADDGTWTVLLTDPAERWYPAGTHQTLRTEADVWKLLSPVVYGLITRAVTLLAVPI